MLTRHVVERGVYALEGNRGKEVLPEMAAQNNADRVGAGLAFILGRVVGRRK